ncbi:MAG: hypothetical protein M0P94_02395 [Candidatus Absconditabacterales bacterium]|nr:hypothetical protein [Candidatus Absconditabacterales bacterium]
MAELVGSGITHSPVNAWKELENQDPFKNAPKTKRANGVTTLALVGLMSLGVAGFSSCCEKTVDQEINTLVKNKQEQVDNLTKKEIKLQKKLDKVKSDKKFAEKELRDAKSRQR